MDSPLDDKKADEIRLAIQTVNSTPGLRIEPGIKALWRLYKAPNHTLSHDELKAEFGALEAHFGWFCNRVAEILGVKNPGDYALCYKTMDADGRLYLTLRPAIAKAMSVPVRQA